jgi:hypothetical protein
MGQTVTAQDLLKSKSQWENFFIDGSSDFQRRKYQSGT